MSSKKNKIPPKKVVTSPVRTRSVRKTLVELPGKNTNGWFTDWRGAPVGGHCLYFVFSFHAFWIRPG